MVVLGFVGWGGGVKKKKNKRGEKGRKKGEEGANKISFIETCSCSDYILQLVALYIVHCSNDGSTLTHIYG
jgi:hypothetical protein